MNGDGKIRVVGQGLEGPGGDVKPTSGEILLAAGKFDDALPLLLSEYERLGAWQTACNLGLVYRLKRDYERSSEYLRVAVARGGRQVGTLFNLHELHAEIGELERARSFAEELQQILPHNQQVALMLAQDRLRDGEWTADTWRLWELGRINRSWVPLIGLPLWDGEPLDGCRFLLISEGGYGDIFLFSRFAKHLKDAGAKVTLSCWDKAAPLMGQRAPWIDQALFATEILEAKHYDCYAPLLSLPGLFDATTETIPDGRFLRARVKEPDFAGKPLVGICWRAEEKSRPEGSPQRSGDPAQLEALRALPCDWVSLQPDAVEPWMVSAHLEDWRQTANVLLGLKSLVTVDTAVAHLAGMLGVPVHVVVPPGYDWKWLRQDTPVWYEGTIHRAKKPADFSEAFLEAGRAACR